MQDGIRLDKELVNSSLVCCHLTENLSISRAFWIWGLLIKDCEPIKEDEDL